MENSHFTEEQQFSRLFQQEGIDRVPDRLTVLRAFFKAGEHVTSEELVKELRAGGGGLDQDFVRETLRMMCRYGFARRLDLEGRGKVYEHRHLGQHHDHMICVKCQAIMEFEDDALEAMQARVAASRGFYMLQHRMEIYGICADCLGQAVRLQPLSLAEPGQNVVIREYQGGLGVRRQLLAMGLRPGDCLEVITSQGKGQLVVAVDGKRYALGRGLAEKILVQPPEADKKEARACS